MAMTERLLRRHFSRRNFPCAWLCATRRGCQLKFASKSKSFAAPTGDKATLCRALDGVEAMFWCVTTESLQETNVEQHHERFACAACQAIREARTPRVVTISAGGKGSARKAGRISGLHAMEEILNESGAAIRHLRCGLFMENLLSQVRQIREETLISYPIPGHIPVPMV